MTKEVKETIRLAPVVLVTVEAKQTLNRQISIIAATEGTTSKRLILNALKAYRPELSDTINKELKVSK